MAYTYDSVGNVKTITDSVRSEIATFNYDDLDRLQSVSGAYSQSWVYNPIGNITQFSGANYSYTDPAHKHAVTLVGSTAYTYDLNGNMTARGSNAFSYDAENRLTQATVGGVVTQYAYNADSARVKKTVGSTTTYYVGNWFEVTNSGAITKYYYPSTSSGHALACNSSPCAPAQVPPTCTATILRLATLAQDMPGEHQRHQRREYQHTNLLPLRRGAHDERHVTNGLHLHGAEGGRERWVDVLWRALLRRGVGAVHPARQHHPESLQPAVAEPICVYAEQPCAVHRPDRALRSR